VLQCVAVYCSVLQCVAHFFRHSLLVNVNACPACVCCRVCCSVLQCVAVYCSVLQFWLMSMHVLRVYVAECDAALFTVCVAVCVVVWCSVLQ